VSHSMAKMKELWKKNKKKKAPKWV
jgi:hypothetical protein